MFKDPLGRPEGEPLDPLRHSIDDLKIRQSGQPRLFSAVWMQDPRTMGGNIIKTDWFQFVKPAEVPTHNIVWARGWDLAFSEKQVAKSNPDHTAGARLGLWRQGNEYAFYLEDIARWQALWPITRQNILKQTKLDGRGTTLVVEGGGPQKGLGDDLKLDVEFKPFRVRIKTPVVDKVARAQYWVDECQIGKFFIVENSTWYQDFIDECEAFPFGAKDDQVDSVSIAFWFLMDTFRGKGAKSVRVQGLYR